MTLFNRLRSGGFFSNMPIFGISILLASTATFAESIYPEDGWWWNENASGRGFLIERQGNTLFLASFHYASDGSPDWLIASGQYEPADTDDDGNLIGTYTATVYRSANGQCIGCTYSEPSEAISDQSPITIEFDSTQTAQVSWPGETFAISRLFWNSTDAMGQLEGEWILASSFNGNTQAQIGHITSGAESAQVADAEGISIGSIEWGQDGNLNWLDTETGLTIPILAPENRRFYAGTIDPQGLQVVGVRVDDLPYASSVSQSGTDSDPLSHFTTNVIISNNGATLSITTDDLPNHNSPYWGEGSQFYESPHDGMVVNPNQIQEQDITFRIPANPEIADSITDTGLGPIGVSVNGVVFFNQYAGQDRTTGEYLPLTNEIATFDFYNGHPQGTGQYHYHLEPYYLTTEDSSDFIGFAMDGFPIYGPDNADGSSLDLDECNGENHATSEYPDGIYHYHSTSSPPYLVGCFKGSPGTVTQ